MGNLDWVDDFMPSLEGIALKAAREEGITFKQWVTIHGHPVNLGGGSSGGSGGGSGGSGAGNAFHGQVVAAHNLHHTYDAAHPDPASKTVHINKGASGSIDQAGADKAIKAGMFNQGHMSFGKAKIKDGKLHVQLHTAGTNSAGIERHLNTFHQQTGLDPSIAKSHLKGGDLRLEFPIGEQAGGHARETTPAKPKVAGGKLQR